MLSLTDIAKHIDKNGILQKISFHRAHDVDRRYMEHRARVSRVFDHMGSYILFKYFGIHPTKRDDGLYTVVLPEGYDEQRIIKNDYPYSDYGPNVEHMLVWSTRELLYDECVEYANRIFMSAESHGIWFVNRESAKSIPQLWHMHVLVDTSSQTMHHRDMQCL